MFRLVPPAGAPIRVEDALKAYFAKDDRESIETSFANRVRMHCGQKHILFFNTGRAALAMLLDSLVKLSHRSKNEVIVPAYTCFSVAAAVAKSKLKIRLIDINPSNLDFDYEKLGNCDLKNTLAIIGCNLFGIINDWHKLRTIAASRDIFLIDDAAQSMGSQYENYPSGSLGDAGIYSLDRGKCISTYSGGILVTNNDKMAELVCSNMQNITHGELPAERQAVGNIISYSIFLKPNLYRIPTMLPWLRLGETVFDNTFEIGSLTKTQMALGINAFGDLEKLTDLRRKNARLMADEIHQSDNITIPGYDEKSIPAYLRLPVLLRNKYARDEAIEVLKNNGISASQMYPSTIRDIPDIAQYLISADDYFPGAQEVVDKLLVLPTHAYLTDRDINTILSSLKKVI